MKVKFWTIQRASVLNIIKNDKIYFPDFKISNSSPKLYDFLLKSFNIQNNTEYKGLIFAFAVDTNEGIKSFADINDFKSIMISKKDVVFGIWSGFDSKEDRILCVEKEWEDGFNPLFIDINDFQYLMPPITHLPQFKQNALNDICQKIATGNYIESDFPSYILQAHFGFIQADEIIGSYPLFSLDE